ncbi:MAG: hypothetical protein IPO21_18235 [Bacteroidales bacterium]|nr:hypothetical protein [Bacteroidales bacterium]
MKNLLMKYDEPSDFELSSLMIEVAKEAKAKALIEKQHLKEIISQHIVAFQTMMNSK